MTLEELYDQYMRIHNRLRDLFDSGCKFSCGDLEVTRCISQYGHNNTYQIRCGTYCIGPGRWEIIGSGETEQAAINAAYTQLSKWETEGVLQAERDAVEN